MATEYPPLNRIHVVGYSANDQDFPILNLIADPRVAGYKVPEDLSACPDKRYPNHVFTGAQPISGDQRVRHVWEILPSPWVPFTRYDDDLGPIQGRRRFVKNEGQEASLTSSTKTSYEAREGSALVSSEIEETWSIKVDEDGNSLFPIKDRDFYDASRGPVQERRQLFVPTGEEQGSLENVDGVITQTSYEPYNEFLSVKIVQTYRVDGPQLIGQSTNNEGQLITVTTQRKAAKDYVAPSPTATRTVESNREDAESIVERIVDTPEVFDGKLFSKEASDPAPQKFRVASPAITEESTLVGQAEEPSLGTGDIAKSEQQITKFLKRIRSTFRNLLNLPVTLNQKATNNEKNLVQITQILQSGDTNLAPSATRSIESEALGDGTYVVTVSEAPIFPNQVYRATREDFTPQKFKAAQSDTTTEVTMEGEASPQELGDGEFVKSEEQINKFLKRVSTTTRAISEVVTLAESVITNEGQIGTRTLTLKEGDQLLSPSATTIEGNVESLGDGRTVKTEITVPSVFPNKLISSERPDPVPQKFRVAIPTVTNQENVQSSSLESPNLESGVLSQSEQQITEFVKRKSIVKRDVVATKVLNGKEFTSELGGGYADVQETYPFKGTLGAPAFGTISDQVEDIGDGTKLRRSVKLPDVPTLYGQEYDDNLDIIIPYEQYVKHADSLISGTVKNSRITPRDVVHSTVISYKDLQIKQELEKYYLELPAMVNIKLPDKLIYVSVVTTGSASSGEGSGYGDTYFWSSESSSSRGGSIVYDIEEGFSGTIPATRAIFFLDGESGGANPDAVFAKVSDKSKVKSFFPNIQPISHEIVIMSGSVSTAESRSVSFDSGSSSRSRGGSFDVNQTVIPPTIHGELTIGEDIDGGGEASSLSVFPTTLPSTPNTINGLFPTGKYLYQINATPYRFKWVQIEAIIVDIRQEYV